MNQLIATKVTQAWVGDESVPQHVILSRNPSGTEGQDHRFPI